MLQVLAHHSIEDDTMSPARRLVLQALRLPLTLAITAAAVACMFRSAEVTTLSPQQPPAEVKSPVKAHILDGSTVLYPNGVRVVGNTLVTTGQRYALGAAAPVQSAPIPLDSVVGMETYDTHIHWGSSVAASGAGLVVGTFGAAALAVALFGSCPTFYSDSAGTQVLEAEGFSYSIAPLFEQRDVDRLRASATADGKVVLRVRNEALETHYINNLELIEVRHASDELAVPDQSGRTVAVRGLVVPAVVRDRAGRDLSSTVRADDGVVFSTAEETLRHVSAADLNDYIDITLPATSGADSVAIVLDMRNSLLNTVLLYDQILGAPGTRSLDWLARDLGHISNAIDMGRWYSARMGMRISVREGRNYRQVARIGDSGPIAYHEIAVLVPVSRRSGDSIHVRLSFVADDWRIDAIRAAAQWRRPNTRRVPVARVEMYDPAQDAGALRSLRDADEGYLITTPGQAFTINFDVGGVTTGTRTFMLASQGYYTEWVRGSWIKQASGKPFTPSDAALVGAINTWHAKQREMERQFYSTRISAR